MILNNKGRRNNVSNQYYNQNQNSSPTNFNQLNDTDNFFNESAFQPNAQSTYYQPPTPQHNKQSNPNFHEPVQPNQQPMNNSTNFFNPNMNNQFNPQPQQPMNQMNPGQKQENPVQNGIYNPNQIFNDPMASMAMKYGSSLADQGKEYVTQNVDRWFSISRLKYYFAVDTTYVTKKLLIILFPFINKDWSVKYSQTEAVPPKLDVNAPDLYIPIMSFVTYILIVGICLGTQEKFTPELLGIQASSALGWFIIEVILIIIMMQILSVKSALKTFDILSFCGYKYFGMIFCLASNLLLSTPGYSIVLAYMCIAITYFMVRNLKLMILASENDDQTNQNAYGNNVNGNKRRIYVLLFVSLLQPFFMWWLTRHLV